MKRRPYWLWLVVGLSVLFMWQCTPADDGSCTLNTDCKAQERCIRRTCKPIPKPPNDPPRATISKAEVRVRQGIEVSFDGSKSVDPEGDKVTYEWKLATKPQGSQAELKDADKNIVKFTPDVEGDYIVELIVKDKQGQASRPARARAEVYGKDVNGEPVANAGPDQVIGVGQTAKLDGSGSSDPESDALSYKWTLTSKPAGSQAELKDAEGKSPTFVADKEGDYIVTLVVNDGLEPSAPDTVTVSAINDIDLQPEIAKVTPAKGYIDTNVDVKIEGKGFSNKALVIFRGRALSKDAIKGITATTIEATLSLNGVTAKEYDIVVRNPNAKESKPVKFKALAIPKPELRSLTPSIASTGIKKLIVTAKGVGFTGKAEAMFRTTPLKTTVKSDTELTFEIDLSQTIPGSYEVFITNPGGRASDRLPFKVTERLPPPVLNVLNPPSMTTGKKGVFTVHGVGFSPGAVIMFNGKELPSKRVSRSEVAADPELDLTNIKPGKYNVVVRNVDGNMTKPLSFLVEEVDPTPVIDRILPFFVYLDDDSNKLGVYGQYFRPGAKFFIGTTEINGAAVTFKSSTYLEVKVDTTKGTWKGGDVDAYLINPGSKKSNKFKLTVAYRVPSISSITPGGWFTKCDTTVNIYGTNFLKKSKVFFDKVEFSTTATDPLKKLTYISDKHLQLKLNASKWTAKTYSVYIDNGPSAISGKNQFLIASGSDLPTPQIREIQPGSGRMGDKVTVNMSYQYPFYFRIGAVVYLDGKAQKTTCSSSSTTCYSLGAELDLSGLKPGVHQVHVQNPCGVKGPTFPFLVIEPEIPVISQLSPAYAKVGDKFKLTVKGAKFNKGSKLLIDGKAVSVTTKSDTELVTENALDFAGAKAGVRKVQIDNGANRKSAEVKFSVLDKTQDLRITTLAGNVFDPGKTYKNVGVIGSGFTKTTEIYFNGAKVAGKYVTLTQMTIDLLDTTKLKPGTYTIYLKDGSKQSNEVPLMVKPPKAPTLTRMSPTSYIYTDSSRTLYVYGMEFCERTTPTSRTCKTNPKIVVIRESDKKDFSSSFTFSRVYLSSTGWSYAYVYGRLNKLPIGMYRVYYELKGVRSNPGILNVLPVPPPSITQLLPDAISKGVKTRVEIRGSNFQRGAVARIGLQNYPTTYSGTSRLYLDIDGTKLNEGTLQIVLQNPDNQRSKPATLTVLGAIPPVIHYASRDTANPGQRTSIYLYGVNFASGAKVYLNGKEIRTNSISATRIYISTSYLTFPASTKNYEFQVVNPDKLKSNIWVTYNNAAAGLYLSYTSPDYASSLTSSRSVSLYGLGITAKTTVLVDGKAFTARFYPSSYRSYMRITMRAPLTAKAYKIELKEGTKTSNALNFSALPSTAFYISYMRATSVLAGVESYPASQFYISGRGFTASSKIYFNGKLLKTAFSSASRLLVDEELDFTKLKPGTYYFEVRDGTKKTNLKPVRIETGLQRGNFFKPYEAKPFWVKANTKKTVVFRSYYTPTNAQANYAKLYRIVITGNGLTAPKVFTMTPNNSSEWKSDLDLTGFKPGLYNLYYENTSTKERSGGLGLVVVK